MLLAPLAAAPARPITARDLATLRRLTDPAVSPDGRMAAYQLRETDWAANRRRDGIWLLDLATPGAPPRRLAADPAANETAPAFSPDGRFVYFLSDTGGRGTVWRVAVAGGAPSCVTDPAWDLAGFKLAPSGDRIAVWADRPPGARSLADVMPARSPDEGTARVYDRMFVRHWDAWADGQRTTLFVLPLADGHAPGAGVSVVGGLVGDVPGKPFGGGETVSWSADGRTIYFALREAGRIEPLSTNLDIFAESADGSGQPVNLTVGNPGTDTLPTVSPDGKTLAYVAMARAGYEADRQVLMLRDLASGTVRALTAGWDRSVATIAWAPDGRSLLVTAEEELDTPLFRIDAATGGVDRLTRRGNVGAALPLPDGGAVVALDSALAPADLWRVAPSKQIARLTAVDADKLAGVDMPSEQRFSFEGAGGDTVTGIAYQPAGTPPGKKLPVAFLVHGGPQGSFNDSWSYRWNPAVFAGAGFGVVTVDFHGSTGHGQAFTDSIRQDWGGKPLTDLKLGLAAATAKFAWLDAGDVCAAGASYGGYMMYWIEGNWPDRFKCIVSHDGVFDARAMAYETEELWFDEWEHGGHPYYEAPAEYEKWNPVNLVGTWRTPTLIITNEQDFRIPVTQGLAAFTALQRRDVPSRLLVFPDENHWVLKPRNSVQWYGEVLGWMKTWTAARR